MFEGTVHPTKSIVNDLLLNNLKKSNGTIMEHTEEGTKRNRHIEKAKLSIDKRQDRRGEVVDQVALDASVELRQAVQRRRQHPMVGVQQRRVAFHETLKPGQIKPNQNISIHSEASVRTATPIGSIMKSQKETKKMKNPPGHVAGVDVVQLASQLVDRFVHHGGRQTVRAAGAAPRTTPK